MSLSKKKILKLAIITSALLLIIYVFLLYRNKSLSYANTNASLFPKYNVTGILKYNTYYLKKGDKVTILWSSQNQFYYVNDSSNRKIKIPWGSLYIEDDTSPYLPDATEEEIEQFINSEEITSGSNFLLWTDLSRLKTYAFIKIDEKWELLKTMPCSAGDKNHPTPTGTFEVLYTPPFIGTEYNYLCKNAVVFFRGFMYHSVLFDWSGKTVIDDRIGYRISNGCIRLSVEDSMWIYKNIPIGSAVYIR